MSRYNNKSEDDVKTSSSGQSTRKANGSRKTKGKGKRKPATTKERSDRKQEEKLELRSNNPAWYYTNEMLAEQVSQMSFQQLAGLPFKYGGRDFDIPNIVRIHLNPSPGVQLSKDYGTALTQTSGINMTGFKLFSKISAYTGRIQSYSPSDVSTMILGFGEIISLTECIRRMFGVAYTMNMRNRSYPREILNFGMLVDADDLFTHLSNYRTQFNTIITMINQLPIPVGIAYFDKCAAIYEHIYLDSDSSMAQTLIPMPYTTWALDESSYVGGTVLRTTNVIADQSGPYYPVQAPQPMSFYLNLLNTLVNLMLTSSTLQVVYTDLLNLANKVGQKFWALDYLSEGYVVTPVYDQNFMLQMHNATITSPPVIETTLVTGTANVTPLNDVFPDPNTNTLFYNPAFAKTGQVATGYARTGDTALIDMFTDTPSLTDRVEVTRYTSICKGTDYQPTTATAPNCNIDCALPDHYVVSVEFYSETGVSMPLRYLSGTIEPNTTFPQLSSYVANIDWAPRIFEVDTNGAFTGHYTSDLNFYTMIDGTYLRKLHDFVGLALYDLRTQ